MASFIIHCLRNCRRRVIRRWISDYYWRKSSTVSNNCRLIYSSCITLSTWKSERQKKRDRESERDAKLSFFSLVWCLRPKLLKLALNNVTLSNNQQRTNTFLRKSILCTLACARLCEIIWYTISELLKLLLHKQKLFVAICNISCRFFHLFV